MTDQEFDEQLTRFVEQFISLTDSDVRRLAIWTRELQGDQPESGREWRSAASREFNSVGDHPAQVAYDRALTSARDLLAQDARSVLAFDHLLSRLGDAAADRKVTVAFAWRGRRRALWGNRLGLFAGLGCLAFLALAIGVGLGGRHDQMAVLALIAFSCAAIAFMPYVAWPVSSPTEPEAREAIAGAIIATALQGRLSPSDYERLIDPWRRAIDVVPPVDPPLRWRTAVLAGRLGIAAMTGGGIAFFSLAFLQQLAGG